MGFGNCTGLFVLTKDPEVGDHVIVAIEEMGDGFEVGVFGEANGIWSHDEGVSVVPVGFRESAIDGDSVASIFDRVFAIVDFNGDVAIDDEDVIAHTKGPADFANEVSVMDFFEVGVFVLAVGFGVVDEIALEGGHAGFPEERRVGVGPEPIVIIEIL